MSVKNCFLKMSKYAGLFRKMPVNASGMDFTHKCRHFPNPGSSAYIYFRSRLNKLFAEIEKEFEGVCAENVACKFRTAYVT